MAKAKLDTPYMTIPNACRATGLSQYFLRNGCKDGSIPHIKSGNTYYINVPAMLEKLAQMEKEAAQCPHTS